MGLAISLVSKVPEKIWYHGEWCPTRGRNCQNTSLTDQSGCCVWYNEQIYLANIEDHLNVTIQQIDTDTKVPLNGFDGKVMYGQKIELTWERITRITFSKWLHTCRNCHHWNRNRNCCT